jgi:sec-independent protein translocase protein TatA
MCLLTMNLGFPEMVFLVLIAFMLFGPKRLPEIARQLGKCVAEFKKASNQHIQPEIAKLKDDEDLSLTGALNRLTERIKNSVPQDYDA